MSETTTWWFANRWGSEPTPGEVVKETAQTITLKDSWGGRRENKESTSGTWHPTRSEAIEVARNRLAREATYAAERARAAAEALATFNTRNPPAPAPPAPEVER